MSAPVPIPTTFFAKGFQFTTAGDLITVLLPNLIIMAGIISFLLVIYYGWRLVEFSGSEAGPQQIHKAQQAVTYSLIGFLLIVSAYFITQIISTIIFGNPTLVTPPTL